MGGSSYGVAAELPIVRTHYGSGLEIGDWGLAVGDLGLGIGDSDSGHGTRDGGLKWSDGCALGLVNALRRERLRVTPALSA